MLIVVPKEYSDINEMVINPLTAVKACGTGFGDDLLKIPVIAIAKSFGKITT